MRIKTFIGKIIKFMRRREIIAIPTFVEKNNLFEGKTALIIGGSGGIGRAITRKLLYSGCRVIISGTNDEKLKNCIRDLGSDNVKGILIDLNDITQLENKLKEAESIFDDSKIDILVNCAGYNPKKNFFESNENDFEKTININVKGVFFVCQYIAKYMIDNNIKGHILNISSSSALRPAWSPYELSKWAIRGFTIGLADTLLPHGIIVNAIAPGPTATSMLNKKEDEDLFLHSSPIERYTTPDEIANLAIILVSDIGNIVVGDTLYATGGSGVITLHK